jgi:hypothetical protein
LKGYFVKNLNWGEIALWIGFVGACAIGLGGESNADNATTVAGLFALAAIGVRATRVSSGASAENEK